MQVRLQKLGKRFEKEWIFRKVETTFEAGESYAILGPNGSGKSTLLQTISGSLSPTTGKVIFNNGDEVIEQGQVFKQIGYCAPYMQLMEEFTLYEQLSFHQKFKPFLNNMSVDDLIALAGLQTAADRFIVNFSSGMKQRVKLLLAILSATPVVILDEPATNLDAQGVAWYRSLVKEHTADRLLLVGSNRPDEYDMCKHQLEITDFK